MFEVKNCDEKKRDVILFTLSNEEYMSLFVGFTD